MEHGKLAVYSFVTRLLEFIFEKHQMKKTKLVHIFSDGAASQFKQRYLFSNLHKWETKFGVVLKWHFFATSHGKGVVDGLGGTAKRVVWDRIRAGTVVTNAEECCTVSSNE